MNLPNLLNVLDIIILSFEVILKYFQKGSINNNIFFLSILSFLNFLQMSEYFLKKFNTENAGINPALAGEYQVTRLIMSFLG